VLFASLFCFFHFFSFLLAGTRRWKQLAGRGGAADLLAGLALSFGGVSYDRSPIGHGVSGDVIGDSAVRPHLAPLIPYLR
jgi:hypothetical protein